MAKRRVDESQHLILPDKKRNKKEEKKKDRIEIVRVQPYRLGETTECVFRLVEKDCAPIEVSGSDGLSVFLRKGSGDTEYVLAMFATKVSSKVDGAHSVQLRSSGCSIHMAVVIEMDYAHFSQHRGLFVHGADLHADVEKRLAPEGQDELKEEPKMLDMSSSSASVEEILDELDALENSENPPQPNPSLTMEPAIQPLNELDRKSPQTPETLGLVTKELETKQLETKELDTNELGANELDALPDEHFVEEVQFVEEGHSEHSEEEKQSEEHSEEEVEEEIEEYVEEDIVNSDNQPKKSQSVRVPSPLKVSSKSSKVENRDLEDVEELSDEDLSEFEDVNPDFDDAQEVAIPLKSDGASPMTNAQPVVGQYRDADEPPPDDGDEIGDDAPLGSPVSRQHLEDGAPDELLEVDELAEAKTEVVSMFGPAILSQNVLDGSGARLSVPSFEATTAPMELAHSRSDISASIPAALQNALAFSIPSVPTPMQWPPHVEQPMGHAKPDANAMEEDLEPVELMEVDEDDGHHYADQMIPEEPPSMMMEHAVEEGRMEIDHES